MTRTSILAPRFLLIVSMCLALVADVLVLEPKHARAATATTTTALNLRATNSPTGTVKLVMPAGSTVEIVRKLSSGYYRVLYQGIGGYAHGDYLSFGGSTGSPSTGGATGAARTTSSLNLRAGPSTSDRVLQVMPSGASITLSGESSNGFLRLTYLGTTGWASSSYISSGGATSGGGADPGSGNAGSAVTISALKLRSGPSTSDSVLLVMPTGATVTLTGKTSNGFSGVVYQGTAGWASATYLSTGGSSGGGSGGLLVWPMTSGGAWEIIQGYQGGTHNGTDTYSFDLALTSGRTAGQDIYAPVSGTILWNDVSSGGIAIDMGNGYMVCMFHVTFSSSLTRGTSVGQGQWLGTISAPGGAGYQVTPHVHFQLWTTSGNRVSTAFTGDFAVSGQSFPDVGGNNQHGGTVVYP